MYLWTTETVRAAVARDVTLVRRGALEVLSANYREEEHNRGWEWGSEPPPKPHIVRKPFLGIIAVVGPGEWRGETFDESLLLEIGIGRGVPYHAARIPRSMNPRGRYVNLRRPCTPLDQTFLESGTFSHLCRILQSIVDRRVSRWATAREGFVLKTSRAYFNRSGRSVEVSDKWRTFPRGVRVSIAKRDEALLGAFYDMQFRSFDVLHQVKGLVGYIDTTLTYRQPLRTLKSERAQGAVAAIIAKYEPGNGKTIWPRYFLPELVPLLKPVSRRLIGPMIEHIAGWDGRETAERRLARNGAHLFDNSAAPKKFGTNPFLSVRDISGLRPGDAEKDHVVFEVFPSAAATDPNACLHHDEHTS